MLNTKAAAEFLRPVAPLAETLHAVAIPGEAASLSAAEAAAQAVEVGLDARPSESVTDALSGIVAAGTPGRILICGSLYLAGWVLGMEA
jgi:dihydrofolate synthase/folylpolyglutamate synthase